MAQPDQVPIRIKRRSGWSGDTSLLDAKLRQAVALHTQGQLARAKTLYEEVLMAQPRHFDALHLLGVIEAASGNPGAAVGLIGKALELEPTNALAHNNRGAALHELGDSAAALACFEQAARLDPTYAEPLYNRGNVFKDAQRWESAVASYDRAIGLRSIYADAHCNRGICLAAMKQWASALASYDRAIACDARHADAYYNRGNLLCEMRRWQDALESYDRAIGVDPGHAAAHANRAFALKELGRMDAALASCDAALSFEPQLVEGLVNRASVLVALHRVEEALASYDAALAIDPQAAATYVNRGMARLLVGDFERGWRDYEWRWKDRAGWIFKEKRNFTQPLWLGETAFAGSTILLHSEQGYGDTLQFCRYTKSLADLGARVILEVPHALAGLMHSLEGVAQVVIHGEPLPAFDYYCPLLSLPLALNTSLATIPADIPYLRPSEAHRHLWRERLGEARLPRVGLVWAGGHRPDRPELWSGNARRNIALAALSPLAQVPAQFYSLQPGEAAAAEVAELRRRRLGPEVIDLTREIRDFADTAALIEQLDLVISVDTATAHLAGALGKPVWILNRFDTCWRWLLDRCDSPWYPTARLYRQKRPGDWEGVVRRLCDDLHVFIGAHSIATTHDRA